MISDSSLISENSPLSSNHLRETAKCDVLDLLKLVYKKVDAIEDHLIKLDVRIANMNAVKSVREKCTASSFEIIDLDQLTDFNLPVKSESDLETLEKKLETNQEFRMKLVSRKYLIILFTIQMKCYIIMLWVDNILSYKRYLLESTQRERYTHEYNLMKLNWKSHIVVTFSSVIAYQYAFFIFI